MACDAPRWLIHEARNHDLLHLAASCLPPQGNEKEAIVPALTSVFAEALRGGVSNLSFGELSGNLGEPGW